MLLKPHRSYLQEIYPILQNEPDLIKGLAHITGGGFYENIPRILPKDVDVVIYKNSWEVPPLYRLIETLSKTDNNEMYRIFNQGIGLIAVVAKENVQKLQSLIGEKTFVIGETVKSEHEKSTVTLR